MMKQQRRIFGAFVAVVMAAVLLAIPGTASADACVPLPGGSDFWSLPPEMIVWYFLWSAPGLVEEAVHAIGSYDWMAIIQFIVGYGCASY